VAPAPEAMPPCPVCGRPIVADYKKTYCDLECWRRSPAGREAARYGRGRFKVYRDPPAPSPEQIAARCAEVRAGWSAAEHRARLRPDWRAAPARVPGIGRPLPPPNS
jgi:hypothetical protein